MLCIHIDIAQSFLLRNYINADGGKYKTKLDLYTDATANPKGTNETFQCFPVTADQNKHFLHLVQNLPQCTSVHGSYVRYHAVIYARHSIS